MRREGLDGSEQAWGVKRLLDRVVNEVVFSLSFFLCARETPIFLALYPSIWRQSENSCPPNSHQNLLFSLTALFTSEKSHYCDRLCILVKKILFF